MQVAPGPRGKPSTLMVLPPVAVVLLGTQPFPTRLATVRPAGSVCVYCAWFDLKLLGLLTVMVRVVVPLRGIVVGLKAMSAVGGAANAGLANPASVTATAIGTNNARLNVRLISAWQV